MGGYLIKDIYSTYSHSIISLSLSLSLSHTYTHTCACTVTHTQLSTYLHRQFQIVLTPVSLQGRFDRTS